MADLAQWRAAATRRIFQVTLSVRVWAHAAEAAQLGADTCAFSQRDEAERSDWSLTYLKELADELRSENGDTCEPQAAQQQEQRSDRHLHSAAAQSRDGRPHSHCAPSP